MATLRSDPFLASLEAEAARRAHSPQPTHSNYSTQSTQSTQSTHVDTQSAAVASHASRVAARAAELERALAASDAARRRALDAAAHAEAARAAAERRAAESAEKLAAAAPRLARLAALSRALRVDVESDADAGDDGVREALRAAEALRMLPRVQARADAAEQRAASLRVRSFSSHTLSLSNRPTVFFFFFFFEWFLIGIFVWQRVADESASTLESALERLEQAESKLSTLERNAEAVIRRQLASELTEQRRQVFSFLPIIFLLSEFI